MRHVDLRRVAAFDLDRPEPRIHMYRIVLAQGQLADVTTYLNRDLLVSQWPVLRTLISKTVRSLWEPAFSELQVPEAQPCAASGWLSRRWLPLGSRTAASRTP
jgi:hypothetical protein